MKWSKEKIKEYIESQGYKFIGILEFKALNSKILIQCYEGHIYIVNFKNFKGNKAVKGNRCPVCFKNKPPKKEEIEKRLRGNGFELLSEYKNAKTKLKIKCKNGHVTYRTWVSLTHSETIQCTECNGGRDSVNFDYINTFLNKFGYKLLDKKYTNAHEKLKIQCDKGHIFYKSWNHLKRGQKCPICNISKGEDLIISYLNKNNIKFIYDEQYFKDLLSDLDIPLRPDFILPSYKIWIEYDGEQHFEWQDGWQTKENFERLQKHDKLKNEYAKERGWNLIRIPYWEFDNIEEILEKEINKNN